MYTAKQKITGIVENYKRLYRDEMQSFLSSHSRNIDKNKDNFAQVANGLDFIERKVFELPENLYIMFKTGLSSQELEWFMPSKSNDQSGVKWFVKNFPEFRASKKY